MRIRVSTSAVALGLFACAVATQAQAPSTPEPTAPCNIQPCAIVFDWGSGKTAGSYPVDRKYGSGDDFEAKMRSALAGLGIRVKDAPAMGELTITLRPVMRPRTMCDAMKGTGTDMSCTAMSDVAVTFAPTDSGMKAPPAQRIANRCGGGTAYLPMFQFAQYSAEMIYFTLIGNAKKEKKPVVVC